MIKKLLLAIAIALPTFASAQKFGVVNSNDVFMAMPESAAAQTQLQEAAKKYDDEFKKLQDELQKKFQDFQQLDADATTPQSIKERRMQEIQELNEKAQRFQNTASEDLQRQQQQLMAPIAEKIQTAIKAVGAEGGYTFIFEEADGILLYTGTDVTNLTATVKAKLGVK